MVMGAIAKNQQGSEFSAQVTQRIAESLKASQSQQTSAALIAALGNSGDSKHEALVKDYLQGDSSRLRAQAASALGKIPGDSSLTALSSQLNQESDSKVQSAIIKALGNNDLTADHINTVYQYASSSTNRDVRSGAIDALSLQAKDNASVRPQLVQLLKSEKNKRNLGQLMKALYGS